MERVTVDLNDYPDLVVVQLGMRVNVWRGLAALLGMGPRISAAVRDRPDGLLAHENMLLSLFPLHIGMRQYWRDYASLEAWSRAEPHRQWWQSFLKDSRGTGFWHEAYFRQGGMEAVYVNVPQRFGLRRFAPEVPARGAMFSSRQRAGRTDRQTPPASVVPENELYPDAQKKPDAPSTLR